MADDFKTFDKAPVVRVVNIRKWSFAWREIIVAGIALVLLVLCLVFAGLYGSCNSKSDKSEKSEKSEKIEEKYCLTLPCLDTASKALHLMNRSIDPCENFYEYACGNYKNLETASYGEEQRKVVYDIYLENEKRLTDILRKRIDRRHEASSERKVKEFFQSCTDLYNREKLLGTPFIEKVVPKLGGWDLLGTWNESTWDLNTALRTAQVDFFTDAIYGARVVYDRNDWSRNVILLQPAGTGKWMQWLWYLQPSAQHFRDDYQKFIRRIGSLLMRDAKLTTDSDTQKAKLDQFVEDAMDMETHIARVALATHTPDFDSYLEANRITLEGLKKQTNGVIKWVEHMSYLLPDARVSGSTKVVLTSSDFLTNMTTLISNITASDRKRMLHNYLIWRVAENYVQEMSWEYIHANREIYVDITGRPRFSGNDRFCFSRLEKILSDALGALFISEHFVDANIKKVKDITENLRLALVEQLSKTPWMDNQTKDYAVKKLDAMSFKMGFPDWMADPKRVDSLYKDLAVNVTDYFSNVMSGNDFIRSRWSRALMHGEDRMEWTHPIYGTQMAAIMDWNEIAVPAGALQKPIYGYQQPHYKTFGSLGSSLGKLLHFAVDDHGEHFDKEGKFLDKDSWWTNKSINGYQPVEQCVADAYRTTATTVDFPPRRHRPVDINGFAFAPDAIATINGVRLALKAYRKWQDKQEAPEKLPPGGEFTRDQMVFLSYAQSHCFWRPEIFSILVTGSGRLEEDLQINIALSQLPEFSHAFQCNKTAKMNAAKKCDYY